MCKYTAKYIDCILGIGEYILLLTLKVYIIYVDYFTHESKHF